MNDFTTVDYTPYQNLANALREVNGKPMTGFDVRVESGCVITYHDNGDSVGDTGGKTLRLKFGETVIEITLK